LAGTSPLLLSPELPLREQQRLQRLSGASLRISISPQGELLWEELAREPVALPWPADLLKVTSGTTGSPRLIGFTLAQLAADASNIVQTMGLSSLDRNFGAIPYSHSYGFSNLITPLLFHGIPLILATDPFPRALATGLLESEATVWPAIPTMLNGLVSLGFNARGSLRLVLSAGSPLPPETARLFTDLTNLSVHSFYGSSECGGICFDRIGLTGEGFVGQPLDGVQVEWQGPLEAGAGRIRITSAAVGQGYFPTAPNDELHHGSFSPPDLLEKNSHGWRIAGRASEWINISGRKVAPGIIEAALRNMPGVHAAVVFGVPEPGGRGEAIVALLEGPSAEGVEMLRRRLCQELPAWQIPRDWILVDEIPVNERGKINRAELIRNYLEEQREAKPSRPPHAPPSAPI
jgi:acyl-coenzyme A synthetase/AMP-(fatty) acid ligase